MSYLLRAANHLEAMSTRGVKLSPIVTDNYDLAGVDFILDAKNRFNGQPVFRFAYNPKTRELAMGPRNEMHAIMIHNQTSSPFEQFVRGVWDGSSIYLRWYSTDPYASPDDIKMQSFDAWADTKEMLERNGLPPGTEVQMGLSTQDLKDQFEGYR